MRLPACSCAPVQVHSRKVMLLDRTQQQNNAGRLYVWVCVCVRACVCVCVCVCVRGLRRGAFAVCRLGHKNDNPTQKVAVKSLMRDHPNFDPTALQHEINIMKAINHPRCIGLIEVASCVRQCVRALIRAHAP